MANSLVLIVSFSPGQYTLKHEVGANPPYVASKVVDAALAFYKALKVYPTPADMISIYDKTVAKVCIGP